MAQVDDLRCSKCGWIVDNVSLFHAPNCPTLDQKNVSASSSVPPLPYLTISDPSEREKRPVECGWSYEQAKEAASDVARKTKETEGIYYSLDRATFYNDRVDPTSSIIALVTPEGFVIEWPLGARE